MQQVTRQSDGGPGAIVGNPGSAARRMASTLAREGPSSVVDMIRRGVRWRYRRVLRRSRANDGLLAHVVDSRRPIAVGTPITATTSIATAEKTLATLRVATSESSPLPKRPTVGVVIPTYRDTGFLTAALQSVRDQTYPHWRCVVVDDASPEDVGGVVAPYLSDQRIELLRHASNGGLPATRNTGLRHLDTDMVVFLDADDLLVPAALGDAVDCFAPLWNDEAVAGVHGRVVFVPEEMNLAQVQTWNAADERSTIDWVSYRGDCPFNVHAVVLRRTLVDRCGGFDETLRDGAEDWDLWLRILRHGYRFEPNNHLMGAYRQHPASMIRHQHTVHLTRAGALLDATESWAKIDDSLVVGRGAAAPLYRTHLAHERANRVASAIGMQITADGSLDPLSNSEAFELLDPAALHEARRPQIARAAYAGAARGVGISRAISDHLSPVARDTLWRIGDAVAQAILERPYDAAGEARGYDATSRRPRVDVILAAESAADVAALVPFAQHTAAGVRTAAVDLELLTGNSGATEAWRQAGVDVLPYHQLVSAIGEVADLVVCSPTGPVTADLKKAALHADVRCHVVEVPGRPAPLPCSTSDVDIETQRPTDVERELRGAQARQRVVGPAHLRGWRGSNFPSKLRLEDGPIDADSIERLGALRNRHVGETAVIVGNGPSLNDTEIEILTDVPTFGVNAIYLAADRFPNPITYYVVEDTMVFKDNVEEITAFKADWKLFPAMYKPAFADADIDERTIFFRMNAGFYGRNTGTECHPRFSIDATQRIFCGQSVTTINLQLAHWMGFQRVVLIGMDFSYRIPDDTIRKGGRLLSQGDDPNHFHPDYFGAGKTWNDPKLDRVLVSYHLADEIYRATGREIINATEGGKLDLFPRMSLREAIGFDA